MSRKSSLEGEEKITETNILCDGTEVTKVVVPAVQDRAVWDNKLQFLLGVVSMAVGLGNVWRFPYLCQQNGGGAFLIPYIIMLFLEGMPINLIEMGIGQRFGQGSIGVWNSIHPYLGGLGICSAIVSLLVGLYYNVVICWCFYYLFNSFQSPLPWASCPIENGTVVAECELSSETAYFWYRKAIDTSPSISDVGGVKWWMVLCLLLAWIVVYLCMMRGIQSSGKVMYFTAVFPYIVLVIFFGRAVTLEGADVGLLHMITPRMERLKDPTVWMDAATQVFYSMSLAFGGLIAYSSYNPPKNNCLQDAIVTSFINLFTSTLTAVVVFAVLGFKAMSGYNKCLQHQKVKLIDYFEQFPNDPFIDKFNITEQISNDLFQDVLKRHIPNATFNAAKLHHCDLQEELDQAAEGTGLAFIVFTQTIVELPGAPFWAVIFFLMLLALGLGSQFGTMEGVITNIFDIFGGIRIRKEILTGILCLVCFLIDIIFVTGSGEYWVNLVDSFSASLGLIFIAFFEIIAVVYVYGWRRFCDDIQRMTGTRPNMYWLATWRFISPLIILVIFISSIAYRIQRKPTYPAWNKELGRTVDTPLPDWALAVGTILALINFLPLPTIFLLRYFGCVKAETNIHEASVRRVDTTVSTTAMMSDVDATDFQDTFPNGDLNDSGDSNENISNNTLSVPKPRFKMEIFD